MIGEWEIRKVREGVNVRFASEVAVMYCLHLACRVGLCCFVKIKRTIALRREDIVQNLCSGAACSACPPLYFHRGA